MLVIQFLLSKAPYAFQFCPSILRKSTDRELRGKKKNYFHPATYFDLKKKRDFSISLCLGLQLLFSFIRKKIEFLKIEYLAVTR